MDAAAAAALATCVLVACAGATAPSVVAVDDRADGNVCVREYPIGSNIPVTRCRTREQREAEKTAGEELLRQAQQAGQAQHRKVTVEGR